MQTHHLLFTKQLFNQMLAMKNRSAAAMLCGGIALTVMSLNQLFETWHWTQCWRDVVWRWKNHSPTKVPVQQ
jgi:hypothetical protein